MSLGETSHDCIVQQHQFQQSQLLLGQNLTFLLPCLSNLHFSSPHFHSFGYSTLRCPTTLLLALCTLSHTLATPVTPFTFVVFFLSLLTRNSCPFTKQLLESQNVRDSRNIGVQDRKGNRIKGDQKSSEGGRQASGGKAEVYPAVLNAGGLLST